LPVSAPTEGERIVRFRYANQAIEFIVTHPRIMTVEGYWKSIENIIVWSDKYDATGVLLFEGNDTFVQPWLAAQVTFATTKRLSPLVAVNPIYMHPYTAAKMVSSFAYLYGRPTYLNMITGTALSYLDALNDRLDKEQRYDRLREYAQLITLLTTSVGQAVTYDGEYYKTKNVKLEPAVPAKLQPIFYIAGQSEAAAKTARAIGAVHMQMLPAQLDAGLAAGAEGVHLGIVSRQNEEEAWRAATELYPHDAAGRRIQAFAMSNTDSVWKQRMMMASKMEDGMRPGYWLEPFRNFKADCPYFVGSRLQVAELIARLVLNGIRHIILDSPASELEFGEIDAACKEAAKLTASLPV
jgi:alkanesulfonate monooxygenase